MSSEVEVLRSLVKEQRKQINVMRAALTGREELFGMAADEGTAGWLKQFKRQLKDQMAAEMRAAHAAGDDQPFRDSSMSPGNDSDCVTINNTNIQKHDIPLSEQEFTESLLQTTKDLVSVWFESLKEKYSELVSQVFNGFRQFKSNPTDNSMHTFLGKIDRLLPEAMELLRDEDDLLGNPFRENYSELKELYSRVMVDFANAAITSNNETNPLASELVDVKEEYASLVDNYNELKTDHEKLTKTYQQCAAQRDTVYGDAAAWKHKYDEEKSMRRSLMAELESLPSSRSSTPKLEREASPSGARNEKRIAELRAALSHLEVQLSACCYNGNISDSRNEQIRRRVEAVRRELVREEKLPRR
eukprot:TRINITY_DN28551_c0_g1_i1.p1 TRINITY_DN28551_c0_g1~~TRINITY_DN28551_c0_g1_i1.p1  ORF type:complete len:359 (+),score=75.82 TRINITY_DN28551_c0_g1_i1:83-1159(+)